MPWKNVFVKKQGYFLVLRFVLLDVQPQHLVQPGRKVFIQFLWHSVDDQIKLHADFASQPAATCRSVGTCSTRS